MHYYIFESNWKMIWYLKLEYWKVFRGNKQQLSNMMSMGREEHIDMWWCMTHDTYFDDDCITYQEIEAWYLLQVISR